MHEIIGLKQSRNRFRRVVQSPHVYLFIYFGIFFLRLAVPCCFVVVCVVASEERIWTTFHPAGCWWA